MESPTPDSQPPRNAAAGHHRPALVAIILTALSLVPAGAHLAALPNKIGLPAEAYLTVQAIYRGWALFGVVWLATLTAHLVLLARLRRHRPAFRPALAATVLLLLAFGVFFAWTLPANRATANWILLPEGWEALRRQWEWSHAAGAVLVLASLVCVTLAGLRAQVPPPGAPARSAARSAAGEVQPVAGAPGDVDADGGARLA